MATETIIPDQEEILVGEILADGAMKMMADKDRCTKLSVVNAGKTAKFLLNQPEVNRFIVMIALEEIILVLIQEDFKIEDQADLVLKEEVNPDPKTTINLMQLTVN